MPPAATTRLIARQLATANGQIFEKLTFKQRAMLIVLADVIISTVERKLRAEDNCIFDYLENWK